LILVTVGTQLPFDRLIKAVERWAVANDYTNIMFQTGNSEYIPALGLVRKFIPAAELELLLYQAKLVVGHAGIGTIISCLSLRKPVVIMPRDFKLGEHRNDHQKATVSRLRYLKGVFAADSEFELEAVIESALQVAVSDVDTAFPKYAKETLVRHIRSRVL